MNKNRLTLLGLLMAVLLSACGGKIESLTFTSPDGQRSIDISGEKIGLAGPIKVTTVLHVPAGDKTFSFEHQGNNLTAETVTAAWENDRHCIVTFRHDDGTTWELDCFLLDDRVEAVRKFKMDGKSIF